MVGSPQQPTLADFGSATFTNMTYNPGGATLSPINMVDESLNVIAMAGRATGIRLPSPTPSCRASVAIGSSDLTEGSSASARPSSTGRPGPAPAAAGRRHCADGGPRRLLARRVRWRRLRLRRHPVLRLHSRARAPSRRFGAPNSLNAPIVGMVPPSTTAATSWWPPTAGCSPSVTPTSPGRAPASVAVRAPRWRSCPMPVATATGW